MAGKPCIEGREMADQDGWHSNRKKGHVAALIKHQRSQHDERCPTPQRQPRPTTHRNQSRCGEQDQCNQSDVNRRGKAVTGNRHNKRHPLPDAVGYLGDIRNLARQSQNVITVGVRHPCDETKQQRENPPAQGEGGL